MVAVDLGHLIPLFGFFRSAEAFAGEAEFEESVGTAAGPAFDLFQELISLFRLVEVFEIKISEQSAGVEESR